MPHTPVTRGLPRPSRPWSSELAQDNSEPLDPRYSIGLQFEDAARLLRRIFPEAAERRDEGALTRNPAGAEAPRRIPHPHFARRISAPTHCRARHAIPLFAAPARSLDGIRRLLLRDRLKNRVCAP